MKQFMNRVNGWITRQIIQLKSKIVRTLVKPRDFSIICQNCIGGVLYHDLRMQFFSPTINLFIKGADFVKFASKLPYYLSRDLQMRWDEEYPVGVLEDIEIHFMHYATCQEAKQAWERRKTRINWDKILVLCTDRDGFDDTSYEQWKQIPYPKLLFTANPNYKEDSLHFPEFAKDGMVGDLISGRKFYKDDVLIRMLNAQPE